MGSNRPISSDSLDKGCSFLWGVHSKPLELATCKPDIRKQTRRVFMEVQIRFGLDIKDTGLTLDQAGQHSQVREEFLL